MTSVKLIVAYPQPKDVKAFDAVEVFKMEQEGKILHCELRFGDSVVMMSDEWPALNCVAPSGNGFFLSLISLKF